MRTPFSFFPMPMIVKHTLPSGLIKDYTVLITDVIDSTGSRYAKYPNGAEVRISALRFMQLEMAQSDLSTLEPVPLPEEVIRRDMPH